MYYINYTGMYNILISRAPLKTTVICMHLCTKKLRNMQSKYVLKIIKYAFLANKNHIIHKKNIFKFA
jgi:hypothetical protein